MEHQNQVRAYHFLAGVLMNQRRDPFCAACSAWNNTLNNTREAIAKLESVLVAEPGSISLEIAALMPSTRSTLAKCSNAENPSGQKKAGNCKLPEGVCFVKASRGLLEKV